MVHLSLEMEDVITERTKTSLLAALNSKCLQEQLDQPFVNFVRFERWRRCVIASGLERVTKMK